MVRAALLAFALIASGCSSAQATGYYGSGYLGDQGGGAAVAGVSYTGIDLTTAARTNDPNSVLGTLTYDGTYNDVGYQNGSAAILDGGDEGVRWEWDTLDDMLGTTGADPFTDTLVYRISGEQGSAAWEDVGFYVGYRRHTGGGDDTIAGGLQARTGGSFFASRCSQLLDAQGASVAFDIATETPNARGSLDFNKGLSAGYMCETYSTIPEESSDVSVQGINGTVTTAADIYPVVIMLLPTATDNGGDTASVRIQVAAVTQADI